jgi:putative PEP-CTERM system histidine kinase
MPDIGVISYTCAALAYLTFFILLATGWKGRLNGVLLVAAVGTTTLWGAVVALWTGWSVPPTVWVQTLETIHFGVWILFLLGLMRLLRDNKQDRGSNSRTIPGLVYGLLILLMSSPMIASRLLPVDSAAKINFLSYVLLAIGGLFLVENLYRNTRPEHRWGVKFLCLGIGGMLAYDFFMYAEALLFNQLDANLWQARGVVYAMVMPLIAVSVARNPVWSVDVFISKNAAVHTATLLVAGSYLLIMAAAGYYIRYFGGEWGVVFQIMFLFGAGVALLVLLFSGQLRAYIRVFLGKHFYRHRYDYREQWLSFTAALSSCKKEILPHECIVRAMAEVVDSPGGLLWLRNREGVYDQKAHWGVSGGGAESLAVHNSLVQFLQTRAWVVNLEEYHDAPEYYGTLELPDWLLNLPRAWLIVPLLDQQQLLGFAVITQPRAHMAFNWELRDLLKTAASQAASYLAQLEAMEALAEARQFEGFHRLSAFVLHDIKNLIAQQSLLVGTAARHKHKPEFIEDAIDIMGHSVAKMQRLMRLLRTGISGSKPVATNLVMVVRDAVNNRSGGTPVPKFNCESEEIWMTIERDRMTSVIENLVQNAQDATANDGMVAVSLVNKGNQVEIVIEDTGCGMDADFIRERLFRPFDTTKGDTGMGIGAYECREYVHSLDGEIQVESEHGKGTKMRIVLPIVVTDQGVSGPRRPLESVG